jgi:hypothetical protein
MEDGMSETKNFKVLAVLVQDIFRDKSHLSHKAGRLVMGIREIRLAKGSTFANVLALGCLSLLFWLVALTLWGAPASAVPAAPVEITLEQPDGETITAKPFGDEFNGIGGYDLADSADRAFAFDYNHSGKLDHLVLYRPAQGTIWILRNSGGQFAPVFAAGSPGNGIGGYDLADSADRAFAFDYSP